MRKPRASLNLLSLENKIVPSVSVTSSKGNLTITGDNQMNSVFLSGQGSALKVYVVEGQNVLPALTAAGGNPAAWEIPTYSRGTFNVTGSINVTMGSNNDLVLFTWNDGSTTNNAITVGM